MSSAFSGYLGHKRKAELEEIADALHVSKEGTKPDIESAIRQKLSDDDKARASSRFSGLTGLSKRASPTEDKVSSVAVVIDAMSPKARAASDIIEDGTNLVKESMQILAREALSQAEQLPTTFEDASNQLVAVVDQQLALARNIESSQIIKFAGVWTKKAQQQVGRTARAAQNTFSDGWTVVILTVLAELLFVLAASVPYSKQVKIEPLEWWSRPWTAASPYTLTVPDMLVLQQYGVLRPMIVWLFTTVLIPLFGAHLIVFPKAQHRQHDPPHYFLDLLRPSALTFSILRLALDIYLNRLTATPAISFTYDIVQRFGSLQLLSASIGLAFTTYELLASRQ